MKELYAERMKSRYRKMNLAVIGFFLFQFVWSGWAFTKADERQLAQGFDYLLYQLPIINTIMMPILISVIASRLCDTEIKGSTLKLLFTMQKRGTVFDIKLLYGLKYIAVFLVFQILLVFGNGAIWHFTDTAQPKAIAVHFITSMVTAAIVYVIAQTLSLFSKSQIIPLAIGIITSFLGLFSMFFPPAVSAFILWGYFGKFMPVAMDWNAKTRIMNFYPVPFPVKRFVLLMTAGLIIYGVCKYLFIKKEVS